MKKALFLIILIFIPVYLIFSQITLNPEHDFYKSVQSWQNRGIIKSVPVMRPYPASNIKEILQTVIQTGSEADKQVAEEYWQEITGKIWNAELDTEVTLKNEDSDNSFLVNITPRLNGNVNLLEDSINIGYDVGWSLRNDYYIGLFNPSYSEYSCDGRFDPAKIGPLQMFLQTNDIFSYRNNDIILQAGVFRNGYGDFLSEGVALNDGAFHRPIILFSYNNQFLSYTQEFSMLGATVNGFSTIASTRIKKLQPKDTKYLAFHAIELTPFDWLSCAFYETSVYGKRFDFSYLLPVPYMTAQSFSGFADSIMMGARFKIIPVPSLSIKTDLLVDDLAVNDLVKLNFNSKNRIAWNTGIEWTPEPTFIEKLALNFLIVTPYTYSHWDVNNAVTEEMTADTVNYQNYTNSGYMIGTSVQPNSMQLKVNFDFTPVKNLTINFYSSLVVHANIVETLTADEQMVYACANRGVYSTDGSIYTHPYYYYEDGDGTRHSGYIRTAKEYMNFLSQAHKMMVVQAGIDAYYKVFKNKWGKLNLKAGYTFEFIKNKGVDSNIFPGDVDFNSTTGVYTYTNTAGTEITATNKTQVLDYYKSNWVSGFHDQYKHFIYLGLEYAY